MKSKFAISFLCFVIIGRSGGTDGKEPTIAIADQVHQSDSTVIYCQPPPTNSAPSGSGEHNGNGRRPVASKTGKGQPGKIQHHDYATDGNENGNAYEKDGKYWLVPPFLIGTSSIVVIYVMVHCLYTHCNCAGDQKHQRRRPGAPGGPVPIRRLQITTTTAGMTAANGGRAPTIVLSDTGAVGGASTGTSGSRLVPLVCYDDVGAASASARSGTSGSGLGPAYGRTQLVETQPFLIYEQCDDALDYYEELPSTPRKGSGFLQLPAAIGRRLSQARLSFSSIGRRGSHMREREPRASICFVPVARAISDPSGVPGDGVVSGLGQQRFEAFYCRSCGVHNVVDIGSPICTALTSEQTSKSPPPDGDTSGDAHIDQAETGVSNSLSSPTRLVAMLVPTILVDDETAKEQSATESCIDQTDETGRQRDSTVVVVTEEI